MIQRNALISIHRVWGPRLLVWGEPDVGGLGVFFCACENRVLAGRKSFPVETEGSEDRLNSVILPYLFSAPVFPFFFTFFQPFHLRLPRECKFVLRQV
jgi:hypothetical protein